jgi:CHAT domain-containing protein
MACTSVQVEAEKLRRQVADYLVGIRSLRDHAVLNQQAAELYQIFIAPIAGQLDRQRVLCVIPDDALNQLPFAALIAPGANHYLIEDFPLITNPSASVFIHMLQLARSKPARASQTFLGLSNPYSSSQSLFGLPALPAADKEINNIKGFYDQPRVLSHESATESSFVRQMGDYDVVHLAAHTLTDEQLPLMSSIILADEAVRAPADAPPGRVAFDGQLHAYEIAQHQLRRTRLMILSSCRSGATRVHGEALGGLAQAFFAAGVPSVIASLWEADDESAAELMKEFHRQYRYQGQSLGLSLQQAQLALIHNAVLRRRHPYYWAGYLLTGNGLTP